MKNSSQKETGTVSVSFGCKALSEKFAHFQAATVSTSNAIGANHCCPE